MKEKTLVVAESLIADGTSVTPWEEVRKHLEKADTYLLSTGRPDGRPHLVPVLGLWHDGAIYFCASPASRKAMNLVRNSYCAIAADSHDSHLVVEGVAAKVCDKARLDLVAGLYASKYDWHVIVRDGAFYGDGAPTAGPPPYEVFEVNPTIVFAFGNDESFSPTRWRFQQALVDSDEPMVGETALAQ
jgi:hypothetical protein